MKIKHLIIVSLILAILTIGAVSASEDIADDLASNNETVGEIASPSDDELAANDIAEDSIEETSADDVIADYDDVVLTIKDVVDVNGLDEEDEDLIAYVYDEWYDLDGTVTLSIDNVQYYSKQVNDVGCYIYAYDLKLPDSIKTGKHTVVLSYLERGMQTPKTTSKVVEFKYSPEFLWPDTSVGQQGVIGIRYLSGVPFTAKLYASDADGNKGALLQTKTVNGKGYFVINNLAKGKHYYYAEAIVNGQTFHNTNYIEAFENSPGFSSSISSQTITVGSDVTVTLTGPKSSDSASIFVDGILFKECSMVNGQIKEVIPSSYLPVGTHYVSVQIWGYDGTNDIHYLKTFEVKVNNPAKKADKITLTLKKVKVKKSAKKLVLQATLKINGKKVKGKVIKFKFNKKTLKAKTNKKGIAKVTVKKKFLKKLKVGKKVKYQATYDKVTKKVTVKVKK